MDKETKGRLRAYLYEFNEEHKGTNMLCDDIESVLNELENKDKQIDLILESYDKSFQYAREAGISNEIINESKIKTIQYFENKIKENN